MTSHTRNRSLVLSAAFVVAACVAESQPAADRLPQVAARLAFEIGQLEGQDEFIFGRISGVAVDSLGRVLVADMQFDVVRAYTTQGDYLFQIGRSGSGPGEFGAPCCLSIDAEGVLWVRDTRNARYNAYQLADRSATYLRSVRMVHSGAGMMVPATFGPEGTLIDVGSAMADDGSVITVRYHMGSNGELLREEPAPRPPKDSLALFTFEGSSGSSHFTTTFYQQYGPMHLIAHAPGGALATAVSSRYAISWRGPNLEFEHHITRPQTGPELSSAERAQVLRRLESMAEASDRSVSSLPFGVPDRKAPLRALQFDAAGRLWAHLSTVDGTPRRAHIYDTTGQVVTEVSWPRHVDLRQGYVSQAWAIGVTRDSLGVNHLVGFRIDGEPSNPR